MCAFKRKDLEMKKFECNACVNRKCTACLNQYEVPKYCTLVEDLACWHEVKEEVTLQKLTAEVFDRPDCPNWARYAAADKDGKARFHAEEPTIPTVYKAECWCSTDNDSFITGTFDASDWGNSLVERPAKEELPDWCRVGKWVYYIPLTEYCKIEQMNEGFMLRFIDGDSTAIPFKDINNLAQVNQRPFNEKEMQGLVGKVFTTVNGDASIATDFDIVLKALCIYGEWFKNKELVDSVWQLDGKPCYKLEHLNDKGEWVE